MARCTIGFSCIRDVIICVRCRTSERVVSPFYEFLRAQKTAIHTLRPSWTWNIVIWGLLLLLGHRCMYSSREGVKTRTQALYNNGRFVREARQDHTEYAARL